MARTAKANEARDKILVIVESPSKANTINKYLGKSYIVKSSKGHLIDLPKSRLAVDVDNNFEPEYIVIRGRASIVKELQNYASMSKEVLLASDNDREGEAISYHIKNAIEKKVKDVPIKRIVFNEITKNAILESIEHPKEIDENKVNAQKARRILDRLVGYYISPILWKKIKRGLSAGRVQSVALKMIVEREREIEAFVPKEYWHVFAVFKKGRKEYKLKLVKANGKNIEINSEQEADKILESIKGKDFVVSKIEKKRRVKNPTPPFTTSKMQQEASNKLGFTSHKTMMVAQSLYEGVNIGQGRTGLITYMRTDSTRIANSALNAVRDYIKNEIGDDYLPDTPRFYKNKKGSQDAHEAIRPTNVNITPDSIKSYLTPDQYKLYKLIWMKFVASQMKSAEYEQTSIIVNTNGYEFRIAGSRVVFDGFYKVYPEKEEKEDIPALKEGEKIDILRMEKEQKFTQPPPRYNDASLVKRLEESGIGRPSTYAPTIDTLLKRYYVVRKGRQFVPTELGKIVNDVLIDNFPQIMDYDFTAKMEEELDSIEESREDWVEMLKRFYPVLVRLVEDANKNIGDMRNSFDEETDEICEKCGRKMVKKLGRYGYFLACSGFPECRNTKPLPLGDCPRDGCDGKIVKKRTKRGRAMYGCTNYPECDFMSWDKPATKKCPICGKTMFEKNTKKNYYLYCVNCGYKETPSDDE